MHENAGIEDFDQALDTLDASFEAEKEGEIVDKLTEYLKEVGKYLEPPYTFDAKLFPPETSRVDMHKLDPDYHFVARGNVRTTIVGYIGVALKDPVIP